jgi:hypothetical protein
MGPVDQTPKQSLFNSLRGKAWIKGDIFSPVVPAEAWETVEEWRALKALDDRQPGKGSKTRSRRHRR